MCKSWTKNFYLNISFNLWKDALRFILLSLRFAYEVAVFMVPFAKISELVKYWSQDSNPDSLSLDLCP